jgi:hypothetical protein
MQQFTRGATVRIRVQFRDADGNVVSPSAANVYLSYLVGLARTPLEAALVSSGGYWVYEWDSRDASAGVVFGHARTVDPAPICAVNFEFRLLSNTPNNTAADD